jgi:hypothetical protein
VRCERDSVPALAPDFFLVKENGLAPQRAAAQRSDVLCLYGSSELRIPIGARASDFFRTAPKGFQVSAVGKGGATSLLILQKIGGHHETRV